MQKLIVLILLTLQGRLCLCQSSKDTIATNTQIIVTHEERNSVHYFVAGQKVNSLKHFLLKYPASAAEYKKSRNNMIGLLISTGVALGGLTTALTSKNKDTRMGALLYVDIPGLVGMIYFAIKHKQHYIRSIDVYNKLATLDNKK